VGLDRRIARTALEPHVGASVIGGRMCHRER
jgi:hypothetical protein